MARPFFSILIDTYNHERFIDEALQSVLSQNFPAADREILVVDDGSTDRTPEILRKYQPQIRVLRKTNGGQASAFNFGIPECLGEIVAFLDGDDWWAPGKLQQVAQAMTAEPELGFVGHGIVVVFQDGSQRAETLRNGFSFQANTVAGALTFRRRCAFMGTSRMAIRKTLLDQIGPVPEEIQVQADEYLYTLTAVRMPVCILPEPLTFYRLHADNGFILSAPDPQKLRRKQKSLEALVAGLSQALRQQGIAPDIQRALLAYSSACADQIRLLLDGGWPWETFQTEKALYDVNHPDAPVSHRLFKSLVLSMSLFVPPSRFYRVQQSLAQNRIYQSLRRNWLPSPEMPHIQTQRPK
jgi:glycosyltransferase involved in cell wall biosynthesis